MTLRDQPLRIFIGYDSREPVAYHVLAHSIITRASRPVSITPIARGQLGGIYSRRREALESTEFSRTRFLVPYLSGYQGWSVFMDCDMLCRIDIDELMEAVYDSTQAGAYVCKHDYVPKAATKFLGEKQTAYPRKNWSSLIIFGNSLCKALTPQYVNTASGLDLHRFAWLYGEPGGLPLEYNWLVDEYPHNDDAKILHYTNGGPWFQETANCDHAEDWRREFESMTLSAIPAIA